MPASLVFFSGLLFSETSLPSMGSGLVTLLRDFRVLRLLPGSLLDGLCERFFNPPPFFLPPISRVTLLPDLRKFPPRALLVPFLSTEVVRFNSGGADRDTLPSLLALPSDTDVGDQDLVVPLVLLAMCLNSDEAPFPSGVEELDKTLSSSSLGLPATASGFLSSLELAVEACGLQGVSEWEAESSAEPDLLMAMPRYFLSEALLWLLVMMAVLVSWEAGDDSDDVTASVAFLLILLFVVVGSIGSHLTRAAFEERLVIVVVFLLLKKKNKSENHS